MMRTESKTQIRQNKITTPWQFFISFCLVMTIASRGHTEGVYHSVVPGPAKPSPSRGPQDFCQDLLTKLPSLTLASSLSPSEAQGLLQELLGEWAGTPRESQETSNASNKEDFYKLYEWLTHQVDNQRTGVSKLISSPTHLLVQQDGTRVDINEVAAALSESTALILQHLKEASQTSIPPQTEKKWKLESLWKWFNSEQRSEEGALQVPSEGQLQNSFKHHIEMIRQERARLISRAEVLSDYLQQYRPQGPTEIEQRHPVLIYLLETLHHHMGSGQLLTGLSAEEYQRALWRFESWRGQLIEQSMILQARSEKAQIQLDRFQTLLNSAQQLDGVLLPAWQSRFDREVDLSPRRPSPPPMPSSGGFIGL